MFEDSIGFKLITYGFITFIIVFVVLVILGINKSSEQADKCRVAGGVPQSERGVYRACMKPDNFIKIN